MMPEAISRLGSIVDSARKFAKAHVRLQSGEKGRSLTPGAIFWRFIQDTALTGAILLVLIGATHVLKASVATMKDSSLHHTPLLILEHGIFFSGCFVVAIISAFVCLITALDLYRWLRHSLSNERDRSPN